MTNDQSPTRPAAREGETVALLEEVAHVNVRPVEAGRVRLTTHTAVVEEIARAELKGEAIEVTRVPLNQPVTSALPEVRTEGDTTIVPVFEEVLVIEKRLMLKEELHIRKLIKTEAITVPVELRRQTATVERLDENGRTEGL